MAVAPLVGDLACFIYRVVVTAPIIGGGVYPIDMGGKSRFSIEVLAKPIGDCKNSWYGEVGTFVRKQQNYF